MYYCFMEKTLKLPGILRAGSQREIKNIHAFTGIKKSYNKNKQLEE
jgi:hypothetical protein